MLDSGGSMIKCILRNYSYKTNYTQKNEKWISLKDDVMLTERHWMVTILSLIIPAIQSIEWWLTGHWMAPFSSRVWSKTPNTFALLLLG
mgnify:CR=1 FL=1